MFKTIKKQEENQITKITNLQGVDITSIPKPERNFLPYSFMSDDKTALEGVKAWHFCISGDAGIAMMMADWYICHLCTRRATRELIGKEYKNRHYQLLPGVENEENKYTEIEKSYADLDEDQQKNSEVRFGYVSLCAASRISKKGELFTSIFSHESFGAGENYIIQLLQEAEIQKNTMVKVEITNHSENLKVSRKGFSYLAAWKFSQWQSEEMSNNMRKSIENAWSNQTGEINYWINH